jgi:glycosyltransferase involved in cell wall biosynthesis
VRIAFVAPFGLRAKGTTRARALPLARALARRGHTVALFIPPYDSPEDSGRRWTDDGVDVINVALPRRDPKGFGKPFGSEFHHLRLAGRLLRAVCAWRPDVVHVFKPKGPSGLVGAVLWLMRRLRLSPRHGPRTLCAGPVTLSPCHPVIVDSDDWEGPGGWNDDPRAGYSPLQRRFFAWQERYGLSHANAWTVASECLRDRAIGFGADPKRVFVLPNGVPDWVLGIRYRHTQYPILNTQSLLLYTRFAGIRVPDVVAIWRRVVEMAPEARLTVVGRGLAGEEAALAGLPGVEVAGWVEPEELPALFAKMTVAVIPWANTPANRARSSVKVRELMAAGLPMVAYAVGELPETLGEAGVLVPPGDEQGFAEAVVALLADPGRAAQLAAAARKRARAEFNWDRLAETALAAYAAAQRHGGN